MQGLPPGSVVLEQVRDGSQRDVLRASSRLASPTRPKSAGSAYVKLSESCSRRNNEPVPSTPGCIFSLYHNLFAFRASDDMLTRCLANFLGWMCVYPQGIATDSRFREVLLGQGHIIQLASPTLNCIPQRHVRHKFAYALNVNIITFFTKCFPQPFHMFFYVLCWGQF